MEKKMEITVMGHTGTSIRIHGGLRVYPVMRILRFSCYGAIGF